MTQKDVALYIIVYRCIEKKNHKYAILNLRTFEKKLSNKSIGYKQRL
jgi:hypothetical protein